jgi:hypothetical protein
VTGRHAEDEAVIQSSWRFVVRAARYLGPLLWDTVKYIGRLSIDAVGGLRILLMSWRARRNPARAAEYVERQARLRTRRTRRWAHWRELQGTRRMQVRGAAMALAMIAFAVARSSWSERFSPALPSSNAAIADSAAEASPGPSPVASSLPVASPEATTDIRPLAAQFAADRQRIGRGEWAVVRDVPMLDRGALGAWDDHVVALPYVLKEDGAGSRYRMWFKGCHMAMREFSCGVGHARSADGIVWEKALEPVLVPQEPALQESLEEIAVVKAGGRYYLWYSVMADYFKDRRRASLHLATSADGLAWKEEGQVLEAANENPPTIAHSVLHDGQLFHLWYVTSEGQGRSATRVLQHLSSPDGKTWRVVGDTSLKEALNTTLTPDLGRLTIKTAEGGGFRAYTYGSALGVLTSPDGTAWVKADIDAGPLKAWPKERVEVQSLSGHLDDEGLWLWMDTRPTQEHMRVGVAFRKGR